jgi:YHS domain-containing protein
MAFTCIQQASAEKISQGYSEKQSNSVVSPVESQYVCMINDQYFNKEQIPVEIEGRTYYGCCPMCEGKLRLDPSKRSAIDPVNGSKVDKATAVIGSTPDGKVYYFENQENMSQFKGNK